MTVAYLWLNAMLYLAFAAWCTIRLDATSQAVGYLSLSAGGRCEYATVYGGLQFGLAIFYALCAWQPAWHQVGLLFSAAIYAPIALSRWIGVARFGKVGRTTLMVGSLELLLLAGAVALLAMNFSLRS
ncbi:DUF4345 domain-containing protein [Arenimonas sp.]|uniref:DUF4345 domain-containing protein n=1 Tax=Arenimonas sp. TaxID=1872635 RepID=UPI0039E59332